MELTLKTLCWLTQNRHRSDGYFNYFEVQANTDRFKPYRKVPIDLVEYAVWRFLEPEGKVIKKVDTHNWAGDRFKYKLTSKVDCQRLIG